MIIAILRIWSWSLLLVCVYSKVIDRASSISLQYPGRLFQKPHLALDKVSCSFLSSDVVAITGPSGAGKSSLAKILAKKEIITSGEVVYKLPPVAIAYVNDQFSSSLNSHLSIADIMPSGTEESVVWLAILKDDLGIDLSARLDELQTSQRRCVEIALALAKSSSRVRNSAEQVVEPENKTFLLILDEYLDKDMAPILSKTSSFLYRLNNGIALQGGGSVAAQIFIVTHSRKVVDICSTSVLSLYKGRVYAYDSVHKARYPPGMTWN